MKPFRQKIRETLGLFDLEEEGDGGGGMGGGDAGGSVGGDGGDTTADTGGSDTPTDSDHDHLYHRPFGFGAYWKGPLGKCPKGTKRDSNGSCKKK